MPKTMERFINTSRQVLLISQTIAEDFKAQEITISHIFLAMTRLETCEAYLALTDFDIIDTKLTPFIKSKQKPLDMVGSLDLSADTKKMLELAVDTARRKGHHYIGTAHMLIGILRLDSEEINALLEHFDVETKEILKRAEYYLDHANSIEQQEAQQLLIDYFSESDGVGCFASIMQFLGLAPDNKQDK